MRIVMVANNKGGAGKTTVGSHIVWRAVGLDLATLAIDCDRQADMYRRLVGDNADLDACPHERIAKNSWAVVSADVYQLPQPSQPQYQLVLIDTPPGVEPPKGPTPHVVLIPIDGIDAARNANETIAWARDNHVRPIVVFNGVAEGGQRYEREFERMRRRMPKDVDVAPVTLLRGPGIRRTAMTCRPVWEDVYLGKDGRAMEAFCNWFMTEQGLTASTTRKVANG